MAQHLTHTVHVARWVPLFIRAAAVGAWCLAWVAPRYVEDRMADHVFAVVLHGITGDGRLERD